MCIRALRDRESWRIVAVVRAVITVKSKTKGERKAEAKGELGSLGAPRLNILNGLFAAGEAAQRRSMSAPAAPQKEHRTADRAQEKRCVPHADATCAPCTRDRTGGAQARQERSGRSELVAQVAAHRSDASQQRPCLQPPPLRLVGAPPGHR